MPLVFHYRDAISPKIEKQSDGKYTLRHIPIFECHHREDIHCDEKWMEACCANQRANKLKGYRPRLIIGHTGDSTSDPEKPVSAFLDNYSYDASNHWLYADYVDVSGDLLAELKANKWPGRSAEANRAKPAIETVALLGGTPPYFKLPDLRYAGRTDDIVSIFSECHMATPNKLTDAQLRGMYANYRKYAGLPEASTAGTAPDEAQEADYKKFCDLMKRYESEKSGAQEGGDGKGDAQGGAAEPYRLPGGKNQSGQNKAMHARDDDPEGDYHPDNLSARAQGETVAKYAELNERIDRLAMENHRLSEENERSKWTQKYSEAPLPRGRLNVAEEVGFLMELPEDKRKAYFDRSLRQVAAPSTTPVKQEASGPIERGSEREASEFKKYFSQNRVKYRGDFNSAYTAAMKDFRAGETK